MYLYHLTLQAPTAIQSTVVGNFTGATSKSQEILTVKGTTILELLKVDSATGKVKILATLDTFSVIRSVTSFKLPGDDKEFIVVGNDSGRIIILEYNAATKGFDKVHQETFGRSGCRRTVPGHYVASDPRGRAIMTAAVDRQKFIYVMNRDPSTTKLTISSPLEAHKASTLVFDCVGVDVGFENPIFACLEVEYGQLDDEILTDTKQALSPDDLLERGALRKTVTFYEVDLGLNHATRKWQEVVPSTTSKLVAVPGGSDGPGGILVCCENEVRWHNQNCDPISIAFPSRQVSNGKGVIIISSCLVRAKNVFFFLLQSEDGDLYKLSLEYTSENVVQSLKMRYFDSVSIASSLAVLKSGFLFVPGESANHLVYQIQSLGDYEDETFWASGDEPEPYMPRPLRNLAPIDQMENFAPITSANLLNLGNEETPQLYACQGKSSLSSFNVVRYGLGVNEAAQSELPESPTGVWTLKNSLKEEFHSSLVLSFAQSTTVLSIGESIEEVADSGFLNNTPTLAAFQVQNDAFIQVHPTGVRQISATRGFSEWKSPNDARITCTAFNERQLVVYLENRSLIYFELDGYGNLSERKGLGDLPEEITCMALGPVPPERQRSRFLVIGSSENVVRVISLDPDDCLEPISLQALAASPASLVLSSMSEGTYNLSLDVGLENGVLVSLKLDGLSGAISSAQSRYIGSQPLHLVKVSVEGADAFLALSSRPWLKYQHRGASHMSPLFYEPFKLAAPFASEASPSGVVAITGNTLRIFTVDNLDNLFSRHRVPLAATPKKLSFHQELNVFAILQSDQESVTQAQYEEIAGSMERTSDDLREIYFSFRASQCSSSLNIFDPFKGSSVARLQFEADEVCTAVSFVDFYESPKDHMIAVGICKGFSSTPRSAQSSSIGLYRFKNGSLELVHKTPVDYIPSAILAFGGRLLVGVGSVLRLYDLGTKRLLRKCEAKFPTFITSLQSQGWRITVGDSRESIFYVQYMPEENQFFTFADEPQPRAVSTHCFLDYDSVAVADRFGNFSVLRLPSNVSEAVETDGTALVTKKGALGGTGNPLERLAEYYLSDTIVALHKAALVNGARQVIHYTTVSGALGAFIPFSSRNDALFFQNLELFMRTEAPATIGGRDHLTYRSSYNPVKSVIDGDLCERFLRLSADRQVTAAQALDLSPEDIQRRLHSLRLNIGF